MKEYMMFTKSKFFCSVIKVKFFVYNSTLFSPYFGKSLRKDKRESRRGSNYVWFFLDDYKEFGGITKYKLFVWAD